MKALGSRNHSTRPATLRTAGRCGGGSDHVLTVGVRSLAQPPAPCVSSAAGRSDLLVDLTANLPFGILGRAHIHIGLAALKHSHKIGDGLARE